MKLEPAFEKSNEIALKLSRCDKKHALVFSSGRFSNPGSFATFAAMRPLSYCWPASFGLRADVKRSMATPKTVEEALAELLARLGRAPRCSSCLHMIRSLLRR